MKKAVLLYNPVSGQMPLSQRRLHNLVEQLFALGLAVSLVPSRPNSQGPPDLDLSGVDLLIVYGGDGTIHQGFHLAVKGNTPVALLPAGTANVLARELGIPLQLERALEVIRGGTPRTVYLGEANGTLFHLMAGVGVDGYVIRQVHGGLKKSLGVASYWLAGFKAFWTMPLAPFSIRIGEEVFDATFAVVSNSRFYGGELEITPKASVSEDTLDICLFRSTSRFRFLYYLTGVLWGRHMGFPDVIYRKSRLVEVDGKSEIDVQLDGDLAGTLPMKIAMKGVKVQVLTPTLAPRSL